MENEKDRVTIRIEENATPADVEAAAGKLEEPKETAVVLVDRQAIAAGYYRGLYDGIREAKDIMYMSFIVVIFAITIRGIVTCRKVVS